MAEVRRSVTLVGVTGNGKSKTGNTLCAAEPFVVSDDFASVTQECKHCDYQWQGKGYRVIDTMGLSDTAREPDDVIAQFNRFADRTPDGVDVFLFVVRFGRFEREHDRALKAFVTNCGEGVLKNTILVFTHCPYTPNDLDQKFQSQTNESLKSWLSKVFGVVGVENVQNPADARKLMHDCVMRIDTKYNNKSLDQARQWRAKIEEVIATLTPVRQKDANDKVHCLVEGRCSRDDVDTRVAELKSMDEAEKLSNEKLSEAQRIADEEREDRERMQEEMLREARRRADEEREMRLQRERELEELRSAEQERYRNQRLPFPQLEGTWHNSGMGTLEMMELNFKKLCDMLVHKGEQNAFHHLPNRQLENTWHSGRTLDMIDQNFRYLCGLDLVRPHLPAGVRNPKTEGTWHSGRTLEMIDENFADMLRACKV